MSSVRGPPFISTVHPMPPDVDGDSDRGMRRSLSARSGRAAQIDEDLGVSMQNYESSYPELPVKIAPTYALEPELVPGHRKNSDAQFELKEFGGGRRESGMTHDSAHEFYAPDSDTLPTVPIQLLLILVMTVVPIVGVMINHMLPWVSRAGDVLHDPLVGPIVGQDVWVVWTYPPFMAVWLLYNFSLPINFKNVVLLLVCALPGMAALILVDIYTLFYMSKMVYYIIFYFFKTLAIYLVWCFVERIAWPLMFREPDSMVRADVPRYRVIWNWVYLVFLLNVLTNTALSSFLNLIIIARKATLEQQTYYVIGVQLLSAFDKFLLRMVSLRLGKAQTKSARLRLDVRNSMLYYYEIQLQLMMVSALPFLQDYSIMAAYLILESGVLVLQSVFDADWFRGFLRKSSSKLWPGHDQLLETVFGITGDTRCAAMQLLFLNVLGRTIASAAVLCSGALVRYGPNATFYLTTKNAYAVLTSDDYDKNVYYLLLCFAVACIHGVVARFVLKRIYGFDTYVEGIKLLKRHTLLYILAGLAAVTWAY